MGPFLIAHRALASCGAQVQPAGRRGDEVSHAARRPHDGRGESGPDSAAGEAGVCTASFVNNVKSILEFNQIKRWSIQ